VHALVDGSMAARHCIREKRGLLRSDVEGTERGKLWHGVFVLMSMRHVIQWTNVEDEGVQIVCPLCE
jgi:hypothetical protein